MLATLKSTALKSHDILTSPTEFPEGPLSQMLLLKILLNEERFLSQIRYILNNNAIASSTADTAY